MLTKGLLTADEEKKWCDNAISDKKIAVLPIVMKRTNFTDSTERHRARLSIQHILCGNGIGGAHFIHLLRLQWCAKRCDLIIKIFFVSLDSAIKISYINAPPFSLGANTLTVADARSIQPNWMSITPRQVKSISVPHQEYLGSTVHSLSRYL